MPRKPSATLTDAELRIMQVLWDRGASTVADVTEALKTEAKHFIPCVELSQPTMTDGEAGLRVVRILEAATESIAQRGRIVELDAVGCAV